jgi:hypothetical protein
MINFADKVFGQSHMTGGHRSGRINLEEDVTVPGLQNILLFAPAELIKPTPLHVVELRVPLLLLLQVFPLHMSHIPLSLVHGDNPGANRVEVSVATGWACSRFSSSLGQLW